MAFRPLLRNSAVVPGLAGVVVGLGTTMYSERTLHAEEPPSEQNTLSLHRRKPIYDDLPLSSTTPLPSTPTTPTETASTTPQGPSLLPSLPTQDTQPPAPYRPTPTDRLAAHIRNLRLALHSQAVTAEDAVNAALTRTLALEHSFTSTLQSLAPPKESGEKLFPGTLYVLVSAMAGSIVTRNRNILLRASVPGAVGLVAAHAVLPITMRNVGDLVWTYEERYPPLADAHLRVRERVERFVATGRAHAGMGVGMVQDKVGEVRGKMEEWVKQGK
ncbi:uncharacterized protein EI97DRAFT_432428 [Westerdykella ornata]|uniref:MICOS complex subunit n=1 Tax=Westerdykella ornata TaxID=318751 RepID=A0A6A6JNU6_WESOR|nr:uncharacterized protein EI97DRAFT_432428 [Westerdykella ornata]KAF2277568.1 hypothetical protein EI97DRAFT_432428 [Westerdykella ornata]